MRRVRNVLPVQGPAHLHAVLILVGLLGCNGKDTPATFTEVQDSLLQPSCAFSSCHGSGSGGLDLSADVAYDALVDVPSAAAEGETLVIPGDPDNSYLVKTLMGADGITGDEMPPGAGLTGERLDLVISWIENGAAND